MSGLTKYKLFHRILLSNLQLDDGNWIFEVPHLPSPSALRRADVIKTVSVRTEATKHSMTLNFERIEENRAIDGVPLEHLVLISLEGFRPLTRGGAATEDSQEAPDLQPRTGREVSDYSIKLLRAGLIINKVHYNFYGHSDSQLKSRSCFLIAEPKAEIPKRIEALGDFSKMKTISKKTKRIGLLFSSARTAMTIRPERDRRHCGR